MSSKFTNAIHLLKQNKGSSIVVVIITMLFVMVLGSILLFTTYTGVLVKSAERRGEQNFYDAQTAMTIVKTGIQEAVNASIVKSYPEILVNFTGLNADLDDLGDLFHQTFKSNLLSYQFEGVTQKKDIFIVDASTSAYNLEALEDYFIYATAISDLESEGLSFSSVLPDLEITAETITLKNFKLTHTNESTSLVSSVETDIVINMPEFEYNYTPYTVSSIPDFAFVVGSELTVNGTTDVNGSIYAGEMTLNAENFTFNTGTLICGGDVSMENLSTLTINNDTDFWAREISMSNSKLNINGAAYVYDDLVLDNDNEVRINGTYIGYKQENTPSGSSAILVNGFDNTLNLENVQELILAGRGFVGGYGEYEGNPNTGVGTGESLAVQSNQIAYLLPTSDLEVEGGQTITNPFVFDTLPTVSLTDEAALKYSQFGSLNEDGIKREIHSFGGKYIAYYFLDFETTEGAVNYFKDYYSDESNEENLDAYMNTYFESLGGAPIETTYAPGVLFNEPTLEEFEIIEGELITDFSGFEGIYNNLSQTLSADKGSSGGIYDYIVDEQAVIDFAGANNYVEFKNDAGEVLAIIVNGDYTVPINSNIPLIIGHPNSTGTITVNGDFDGLIITDSKVLINGNLKVNANSDAVREALVATNNGTLIGQFLSFAAGEEQQQHFGSGAWNLDELIVFENWSKTNS